MRHAIFLGITILLGCITSNILAANPVVDLDVAYKTVNFSGKPAKAIAVNGQIPAPTLHFKQGDHVTIRVHNHLDKGTTIHWHGLILPWQMDGVEHVTQAPIPPGGVFNYQFTLRQSGTYWYHAHAGLQEQQGLYGAFIIDPPTQPAYHYNKDFVIVLSDWNNAQPEQTEANLKKAGDYYSPRFPLQPSLWRFIHEYQRSDGQQRQQLMADYKMMQQMRMSIYDLSDVAYDTFLLNGHPPAHPWTAKVNVGDTIRLRFIGAGASSFFHIKIPGVPLHIVHVQGNDVRPYDVDDFTIAPGETYDAIIKITRHTPYIIYAASSDKLGAAYGALVADDAQVVDYQQVMPFPDPKPVTAMGGDAHTMHNMPGMTMEPVTNKYQGLKAAVKTNDPDKPISQTIRMELYGYMDHYIWFINGTPEYKAKPIPIVPGKRYRLIFVNTSMMHHPMHLHGHWFILRNGFDAYDPLLHTIDVPPGATITVDFDADAQTGWWYFHCHNLYHMMSGMARLFYYPGTPDYTQLSATPVVTSQRDSSQDSSYHTAHPPGVYRATFLDIGTSIIDNSQKVTFETLLGPDYNKLQLYMEDAELHNGSVSNADMDIFYWHLISEFWAIKGGVNYFYRPAETPYWQPGVGIEGLLPYFIDTDVRGYLHDGSGKLDVELSRDSQITNNFFIRTGVRSIWATKTVTVDEIGSGLNQMRFILRPYFRIRPGLALFLEYEYTDSYGPTKTLLHNAGEMTSENLLTLGVSILF